ncbi:response regulator [Flavipsychrobacter stenotrophus]|uniref:Response regulator n=1 Tax=Flavipsychrobacter stenotrophus TaxID=2077091 RepID=A0A2S7SQV3_9BACT|nr:response regulator [Flavipsychrobacter stenotrophus]PQJ08946.1 response regulator [Flavipsychrobacter stenotrophus]
MIHTLQNASLNILLADDDADDRYFFEKALNELSIVTKFISVSDGAKLMDYLSKNSENLPDIISLDFNMPRKNGLECVKEIKRNENLKHIPVIMCSTSLGDQIIDVLYSMGAHYYLHKCSFQEQIKCIQNILNMLMENPMQPSKDKFILNLQEV